MLHCSAQLSRSVLPRRESLPERPLRSSGNVSKASGGGAGGSGSERSSSKARLGASGSLFEEQMKKDMELKLCHKCHKPGHQARQCPLNKSKSKVAAASGSAPPDDMLEEDF
jgi:hypothetical protein